MTSMADSIHTIQKELKEAASVLDRFLSDPEHIKSIETAAHLMAEAISNGGKMISCGNGGSHCDAMHFAEELTGRYRNERPALPALCASDPSHISCVGNDYGFEYIFSRFVEAHGRSGDVLLAISTSGNSPNVLRAAETASKQGVKVVGLTGKDGGKLAPLCDVEIRVPHSGYADRIQEIHIKVIHILILLIEENI
ncbi:D-sedoheptulose 7-phosphate isomerase [Roseivirga sp. BDSF3-8]|uniref:D-sedoheptulose 7-phosphate isomerase n=1 Tax=Roseivirga sp. BDSF3-8 TaxID=3241598 RepID=UPI0035319181